MGEASGTADGSAAPSGGWRRRLRRWRWWLAALALVIGLRLALPEVLRRVIASQASQYLAAEVIVGDVDLALYRGGVALKDVALRKRPAATDATEGIAADPNRVVGSAVADHGTDPKRAAQNGTLPSTDETTAATGSPLPPSSPQSDPNSSRPGAQSGEPWPPKDFVIAWRSLAVEIQYMPLFQKAVRLRKIVLEEPRVALDRLESGDLNLMALIPRSGEDGAAASAPNAADPNAAGAAADPNRVAATDVAAVVPTPTAAAAPTEANPQASSADPNSPSPAASSGAPAAAANAEAGPGWTIGIDSFELRHGGVSFRDFAVRDSEPIELNLGEIAVSDIGLSPGVYGQPAHLHVDLAFDEATVVLDASATLRNGGVDVEATVDAKRMPLRRSRLYIPKVGWSAMQGEVDAALTYRLDGSPRNEISGTVALRDLAVRVGGHEKPALAWKQLAVRADSIDLVASHARIADVELDGAHVLVRPHGGDLLPLLSSGISNENTGDATEAEAVEENPQAGGATPTLQPPAPSPKPPVADRPEDGAAGKSGEPPPAPWTWEVGKVQLTESVVELLGPDPPVDVSVALSVTDLSSDPQQAAQIDADVGIDRGSIAVDGAVGILSPGFAGTIKVTDLDVPMLLAAAGRPEAEQLHGATFSADLTVEAGRALPSAAEAIAATDVRASGRLGLDGVAVALPAPSMTANVGALDVRIASLGVPGVIPAGSEPPAKGDVSLRGDIGIKQLAVASPEAPDFAADFQSFDVEIADLRVPMQAAESAKPIEVALGAIKLVAPHVRALRTKDGIEMPGVARSEPASEDAAAARQSPTPAPATAEAKPATSPTPPRVQVSVKSFDLTQGRIEFVDRSVDPAFDGGIRPLEVHLRDVRWPPPSVGDLRVAATSATKGTVWIFGAMSPQGGWLQLDGQRLMLSPFNPYAVGAAGYRVSGGSLSLSTKLFVEGDRYDTDTWLTLHDLGLQGAGGESLFQEQFGVPISMALALLRDNNGEIGIGIPVQMDSEGTKVDVMSIVGGALKSALINALASPLKLVGAFTGGGGGGAAPPAPIAFRTGRSEPTDDGAAQIKGLASLLQTRPGLTVSIEATATTADARWIQEQDLRAEWADEGFFSTLMALPQRGARERIAAALAARAEDEAGELSAEDAAQLDAWLTERPPIPADRMHELAESRLATVETGLRESGIAAEQIARKPVAGETAEGESVVSFDLGVATADEPTSDGSGSGPQ